MTGFVTKKIGRKRNFGQTLKSARTKRGYTIEQAESQTKICAKYLVALEENNYTQLPADAYNIGFVRSYAKFLGLNQEKAVILYREERSRAHFAAPADTILLQPRKKKDWHFLITPKVLAGVGTFALFAGIITYVAVQLQHFAEPPVLHLHNTPSEFASSKDTVTIEGDTAAGAAVTINTESILVNPDGTFKQAIQLNPGVNEIAITSRNRAQKEAHQLVKVLYTPNLAKANQSVTTE